MLFYLDKIICPAKLNRPAGYFYAKKPLEL